MGVLKVNVGTAAVPDWRKVGCGSNAPASAPNGWSISPTPAGTMGFTIFSLTSPSAAGDVQLIRFSGPVVNVPGSPLDTNGAALGIGPKYYGTAETQTFNFGSAAGGGTHYVAATYGSSPETVLAVFVTDLATGPAGRLKLWDGTQWLKEACDSGASDDFNRTASTLGVTSVGALPWSVLLGAWETTGSVARSTATGAFTGGGSAAVAVVDAGVADTVLTLTVYNESGTSGTDPSGIAFRAVDGQNFLLAYVTGLYKISGGTFSVLATWTTVPSGGVLGVTLNGSAITVTGNGTSTLASVTETFQQTATKHGIYGGQVGAQMDDFTLGTPVTGHPLKVNIGTADAPDWVVAACMVPA